MTKTLYLCDNCGSNAVLAGRMAWRTIWELILDQKNVRSFDLLTCSVPCALHIDEARSQMLKADEPKVELAEPLIKDEDDIDNILLDDDIPF